MDLASKPQAPTRARALFVSWLNHETVKNLIGNNSSGVTDEMTDRGRVSYRSVSAIAGMASNFRQKANWSKNSISQERAP